MNQNIDTKPIDFQIAKNNLQYELVITSTLNQYLTDEEKACFYIQKKITFYHYCLIFCDNFRYKLHCHMREIHFFE